MEIENQLASYFKANANSQIYALYKAYLQEQLQDYQGRLMDTSDETALRWLQGRVQQLQDMLNTLKAKV